MELTNSVMDSMGLIRSLRGWDQWMMNLTYPGDMRIHDVFHVSLLRPHRRRGDVIGGEEMSMAALPLL
jgi:hypothetical protein